MLQILDWFPFSVLYPWAKDTPKRFGYVVFATPFKHSDKTFGIIKKEAIDVGCSLKIK
jgi:surface antigen